MKKIIMTTALALVIGTAGFISNASAVLAPAANVSPAVIIPQGFTAAQVEEVIALLKRLNIKALCAGKDSIEKLTPAEKKIWEQLRGCLCRIDPNPRG